MFGSIGMPELVIILVIALIIFGPRKLPELGKSLGRSIGEFKRASNELRSTLEEEIRSRSSATRQKAKARRRPRPRRPRRRPTAGPYVQHARPARRSSLAAPDAAAAAPPSRSDEDDPDA